MSREKLAARVVAVNKANAAVLAMYPGLAERFKPLVGQKILRADGSLLAKLEKLGPGVPYSRDLQVIKLSSNYSLGWTVRTCESVPPHSCVYHEVTLYVGEVRDGILTGLCKPPEGFRTDYTVEEIEGKRAAYEKAKKAADEAQSALHPFGEYDR